MLLVTEFVVLPLFCLDFRPLLFLPNTLLNVSNNNNPMNSFMIQDIRPEIEKEK